MEYLKLDPKMRRKPKAMKAGFFGLQVYEYLLKISAEFDLQGRIRESYQDSTWLAHQWGATPEEWETAREILRKGIPKAISAGLIHVDGSTWILDGWDEFYRPSKTNAQRQAEYRERTKPSNEPLQRVATVTEVTDVTKSNATTHHNTTHHNTETNTFEPEKLDLTIPPSAGDASAPHAKKGKAGREEKSDPRHAELVRDLCEIYQEVRGSPYSFKREKDASAIKRLLRVPEGISEISRRWRIALGHPTSFHRCDNIFELDSKWNSYAGEGPPKPAWQPRVGRATDADKDWSKPQKTVMGPLGEELAI